MVIGQSVLYLLGWELEWHGKPGCRVRSPDRARHVCSAC